jgi:hypothetical protein
MAALADGRYDTYLASYASAVRAYRHPVVIGFGSEMNGTWNSWEWRHASPAAWVAAWRHLVGLFRRLGVTNVTWLWTVNVTEPDPGPIRDWWPGASYVTWVGIDGYFYVPTDSFGSVFGPRLPSSGGSPESRSWCRQSRPAWLPGRPLSSRGSSRASGPRACWGWCGSTPRSTTASITRTGAWKTARPTWPRSARLPAG